MWRDASDFNSVTSQLLLRSGAQGFRPTSWPAAAPLPPLSTQEGGAASPAALSLVSTCHAVSHTGILAADFAADADINEHLNSTFGRIARGSRADKLGCHATASSCHATASSSCDSLLAYRLCLTRRAARSGTLYSTPSWHGAPHVPCMLVPQEMSSQRERDGRWRPPLPFPYGLPHVTSDPPKHVHPKHAECGTRASPFRLLHPRDHRQGRQSDEQCGRVDAWTRGIAGAAGRQQHERKHEMPPNQTEVPRTRFLKINGTTEAPSGQRATTI